MGLSPIPNDVLYTIFIENPFIKGFASFLFILINIMDITPFAISSFTYLCLTPICLDFPLYTWLYAFDSVDWLSQCMDIGVIGFGQIGISQTKFLSHFSSLQPATIAMNFAAMVELAMQVCFLEPQDIAYSPKWRPTH